VKKPAEKRVVHLALASVTRYSKVPSVEVRFFPYEQRGSTLFAMIPGGRPA
jgi:hypothetical protein